MFTEEQAARIQAATPPHTIRPWPVPHAVSPTIAALEQRLAAIDGEQTAVIDDFWRQVRAKGTPLVEWSIDPDERLVTFLYRGEAPHGVLLQADRITDLMAPADMLMRRIASSDLHALTLSMPASWIATYAFSPLAEALPAPRLQGGVDRALALQLRQAARSDPHARLRISTKLGDRPASIVRLPEAPADPFLAADAPRTATTGLLDGSIIGPVSRKRLPVALWSHPRAGDDSPVVLCLDGEVWTTHTPLSWELARRIDAGQCPPLHVLFVAAPHPGQRQLDFAGDAEESFALLQSARTTLSRLRPGTRGRFIVAGQSLGGLFAMHAALRHPEQVAAAVAQSPSLWWPSSGRRFREAGSWFREFPRTGRGSAPVVLQFGELEWVLAGTLRHAGAMLDAFGKRIESPSVSDEVVGGHDVAWWRALLPEAIARAALHVEQPQPRTRSRPSTPSRTPASSGAAAPSRTPVPASSRTAAPSRSPV